jgi:hypothetical protein
MKGGDFRCGSRSAVADRRMARPVYPQLRKYPCVPALTLGAMGCFPEWVGDTTGVPQIAADLLHRQISAAMGQQLPFHGLIYRFLIREAPPGRQAPAASRDKSVCSLPFLLGLILVIFALPNCRIEDRKSRRWQAGVVRARSSWLRRATSSRSEE